MLILSRKDGESIVLDDNIEIKILEIEDGKVKLGIDAPKDIDIYRKEIYLEIEKSNKEASINFNDLEGIEEVLKNKGVK